MDRLDALRTFVAVADHQSFAEAARQLRISPTAASRGIADLEASLGSLLLRRTTRSVRLTEAGSTYLAHCRHALLELDEAALALRGDGATPGGVLVLTAPVCFGRMHILPIVGQLMRRHPALKVELTLIDRIVRLVDEGIDVAVRIGELSDSSLHALKVAEVSRILVASPAYLAAFGSPRDAAALSQHRLITFTEMDRALEWRFGPTGKPVIRIDPQLMVNTADAAVAAAIDGLGITRVLSYQAMAAINAGHLVRVMTELEPPLVPVHLVYQASRRSTVNVRALINEARSYFPDIDIA